MERNGERHRHGVKHFRKAVAAESIPRHRRFGFFFLPRTFGSLRRGRLANVARLFYLINLKFSGYRYITPSFALMPAMTPKMIAP